MVISDDVVGDSVGGFECSPVFGAGDFDGGVKSFFLVAEGRIAFGTRNSNVGYSMIRYTTYIESIFCAQ